MKKWEYRVISKLTYEGESAEEEYLDKEGKNGWELVGFMQHGTWFDYYFKREIEV